MLENSLHLIGSSEFNDGHDAWLRETRQALTGEEWINHKVAMHASYGHVTFTESMTFTEYIEALKNG